MFATPGMRLQQVCNNYTAGKVIQVTKTAGMAAINSQQCTASYVSTNQQLELVWSRRSTATQHQSYQHYFTLEIQHIITRNYTVSKKT